MNSRSYVRNREKKKKRKINKSWRSAEVPWGSWQEVGTTHARKKDHACAKEKFTGTSASIVAQKGPFYTTGCSEHMVIWFSSLTLCMLLASRHHRNQQYKNPTLELSTTGDD